MVGAILKETNRSFQKGMTFCRSIYVKKVMKLLAFIFEQPSYVHSSIAIILMEKRELVALLNLSSWCLVMVEWLFLAVPWGCLRFVIVVFPDNTHYFYKEAAQARLSIFMSKFHIIGI